MSKITILIADDQPLIRDGLAAILEMEERYTVVAKTGDGLDTVAQVRRHRPQLVLMDIHMPGLNGLEATKQIKAEFPDTQVLILTTFDDEATMWEALRHGASGFLAKGVETEKLLSAMRDCLDGRINYPSSIQSRLVQAMLSSEASAPPARTLPPELGKSPQEADPHRERLWNSLSVQERRIARKLKEGKSNQEIADELFLTTGTVKNYMSAIFKKLKVTSRSEALAYLYQNELR